MIHLSGAYAGAATDAEKSQLLAAGEALIASDMWKSTAGLVALITEAPVIRPSSCA